MDWVRGLSISYDWQDEIIRAAITLKLSNFEETGGIIAAHTTSIPEAPGSGRTWDYRYCWLRDAYFVVKALNRIGATQTMEDFISFTLSIASNPDELMRPVYGVVPTDPMDERMAPELKGYRGDGPVRIGNAAAEQMQHDTYGSVILAAMPMFYDRRLPRLGRRRAVPAAGNARRQGRRTRLAARQRNLGISRPPAHPYPFDRDVLGRLSAGSPRSRRGSVFRIARRIGTRSPIRSTRRCCRRRLERKAQRLHRRVRIGRSRCQRAAAARSRRDRSRRSAFRQHRRGHGARTFAREARYALCGGGRFRPAGDGIPDLPVLADRCLVVARPREEARELFVDALGVSQSLWLAVGGYRSADRELWGNFPQTYSMAGLILTAMRLSRSWEDRYWRG